MRNFETILLYDMMPLFYKFDVQKMKVTSIVNIIIGSSELQDITTFSTYMQCNITPSYLTNNTHLLLLGANVTHVKNEFFEIE